MSLLDDMRRAIASSEKSRYRLSKETGISEAHLSRFMAGTKGLAVESLEKLAASLGMEVVLRKRRRNGTTQGSKDTDESAPRPAHEE